ncbi:hypothetical protein LY28_02836 [Ruminiclostridium sufflavum DSM 19573]|uniref:Uncharacterized protein n=1 Tax=Ruminiclostridium sufflavum DSM 19573 TaxID=1121337 RepID=A0A318XUR9_9FIRM|nr:hypothetical protein LY28_02836 [Ruminiclostridium sufflavum DSM 19573]
MERRSGTGIGLYERRGVYIYKFITIRCRSCGAVVYNLPVSEMKKIKFLNIICEDCLEHSTSAKPNIKKLSS